jgi:hypothetical protein
VLRRRKKKYPPHFWQEARATVFRRSLKKGIPCCEVCNERAVEGECAHLHPLGAGRSRHDPDAQCSNCLTMLNHPDNLRWVCLSLRSDCHAVMDKTMRPECRRKM